MGTSFGGKVNLSVDVAEDGSSVAVSAGLNLVSLPVRVRMRLRSGDGRPLRSATINGVATPVQEGDVVYLPRNLRGIYRIVGRF
jgi:hypothetical protein